LGGWGLEGVEAWGVKGASPARQCGEKSRRSARVLRLARELPLQCKKKRRFLQSASPELQLGEEEQQQMFFPDTSPD